MWILPFIGYIGLALGFCFLTLAIASGLYYLSELVEEHTVVAKKLLTRLIYSIIALQTLLFVIDRLPLTLSALSIASHGIYLQNLRFFPIVRLSDPIFLASCGLVVLNHYLWFRHFSIPPDPRSSFGTSASQPYRSMGRSIYDPPPALPTFTEIASFFFIQVWLVPFALFVSLSAGENVLPSMGSEMATNPHSPLAARSRSRMGATGDSGDGGSTGGVGLGVSGMLTPRRASRDPDARSSSAVRGPGDGSLGYTDTRGRSRRKTNAKGLFRVAVDGVREWVSESGEVMGFWQGDRARRW